MYKMCQSNQYLLRYQVISTRYWLADILETAEYGCLLLYAYGSSLQYVSDDYK